jgi:hypothetical protein
MTVPAPAILCARRMLLVLAICLCTGCAHQPVHVLVRDGETGEPVEAAQVGLSYEHNPPFFIAPPNTFVSSAADGTATLDASPGAWLYIEKPGYLGAKLVQLTNVGASASVWQQEVSIYRGPAPLIDLEVAPGARGPFQFTFVSMMTRSPLPAPLARYAKFQIACPGSNRIELDGPLADQASFAEVRVVCAGQVLGTLCPAAPALRPTSQPTVPALTSASAERARLVSTDGAIFSAELEAP